MGVRTGDMGLIPTRSATGFPAAGEWAFGNGGEEPIVFPLGNNGDRVGVWANVATHVRPDDDSTQMQKILFGEDEAVQFGTILIPARCWAEWTFSSFVNAWVPTSASFETPIPPPGGLPDASTGDGWMVTNAFIVVPANATEVVLPSLGAENVPLVSGDLCAFFSLKDPILVRSMVPALAHDGTALQDPVSRHYPGLTYNSWIYMAGGLNKWVPQAAAVGMISPLAVYGALAAMPYDVLFNNKRLRLVAAPIDPTDGATKDYVDNRPGAGNVVGPASSTDGRVAVYSGTTGKLLRDGSKAEADIVTGPPFATVGRVASFGTGSGKILADGGILAADIVAGPAAATDGRVAVHSGASGKLLKDGTKLEADLVTGPASAVDGRLAMYDGATGKLIKVSAKLEADVPTVGTSQSGYLVQFTSSKVIANATGLLAANMAPVPPTSQYNANFTAVLNNTYLAVTAGGAITVTLPASPGTAAGGRGIKIKRWGSNDVVIAGNGFNIDGAATLTLTQDKESAELIYHNGLNAGWYRF